MACNTSRFNKLILVLLTILSILLQTQSRIHQVKVHKRYKHSNAISSNVRRQLKEHHHDITGIYGDSDVINYYYFNIFIGEQKKKSTLILDTGSMVMCLTCKQTCNQCGNKHENPYYDTSSNPLIN